MSNVTKKKKISPNQRYDIADLDAMQDNIENYIARIGQLIGAPLIETGVSDWLTDGVLTYSAINVVGANLEVVAGLEVMTPSGHIITLDVDTTVVAGLPFASAKALMVMADAEIDDPNTYDNRRTWVAATQTEALPSLPTWKYKQFQFRLVDNTFAAVQAAVAAGWVRVATLTTAGVATPTYFFPMNGTGALTQCNSVMGILRRLIGDGNENSGLYSASCGGRSNTNSGYYSASSGGTHNTNSGNYSASSGGTHNTNSGDYSASSGGRYNTNSGDYSASSGGDYNTNIGHRSASSGGAYNTNSGHRSASSGGAYNTNSGLESASSGGVHNTNSGDYSASSGGESNINSGKYSTSSGGYSNTNSGDYSASSGGVYNTNSGTHSVSLGGSHNTNSGDYSVIFGQYCENATDDVICGGYNTTLTPSGANQNLKWAISNRYGTAHIASDFKIGGDVNNGTGLKAKIIGTSGNTYIGGNVEIGGTVTPGTAVSTAPTVKITKSSGRIQTEGDVEIGGDADVGTDWKASIAAASGTAYVNKINIGAGDGATTGMKAQIDANGSIAHLGTMSQKIQTLTGTAVTPAGTGTESAITPSGAWVAGYPIHRITVTVTPTNDLDFSDAFTLTAPTDETVAIVVKQTTSTTGKVRWGACINAGVLYIYNAGATVSAGDLGTTFNLVVTIYHSIGITSI